MVPATTYAKADSVLAARNAISTTVDEMVNTSTTKYVTSPITDKLAISNSSDTGGSTKAAITRVNNRGNAAIVKSNAFVSQTTKSAVNPITFNNTSIEKAELSKLTKAEVASLSKFSGVNITSDATLTKALNISSNKLSSITNSANLDISTTPTSGTYVLDSTSSNKLSTALAATRSTAGIPGMSDEILDHYVESPNITDMAGNLIEGIPSMSDFSTTSALNNRLASLCGGTGLGLMNFGNNLNIFNALLALFAKLGLAGLLRQAADCYKYFQQSGISTLKDVTPDIARNGDSMSMATVAELTGAGSISDPEDLIRSLVENTPDNTYQSTNYLDTTMDEWDVSAEDLTSRPIPYSNTRVKSLTNHNNLGSNKTYLDHLYGAEDRELLTKAVF